MKTVNALNKACPAPVIMAKKALNEDSEISVLVDNEIACENLGKLAKQKHLDITVVQESDNQYAVTLKKTNDTQEEAQTAELTQRSTAYDVVINADVMGNGDDELGRALLHAFVYSLTEQDVMPDKVVLYNGGVKLAAGDSDYLEDLQTLVDKGVEILACGTCLNFYHLSDDLKVGSVTNMFSIVEIMRTSNRIVKPF